MNFSFLAPDGSLCRARLYATGKYGFSVPKRVVIIDSRGDESIYVYRDGEHGARALPTKGRLIVRIAVRCFLDDGRQDAPFQIDWNMPMFDGELRSARRGRNQARRRHAAAVAGNRQVFP